MTGEKVLMVISELQVSLIGAGVAVVVVIFAYNKWQESRHRRMAEKIFRPEHPDVLLEGDSSPSGHDGERLEPSLLESAGGEVRSIPPEPIPSASSEWRPGPSASLPPASEIVEPPLEQVTEQTDCVVHLESDDPIAAPLLWPAQHDALPRLSKSLIWFGLNEKRGAWDALNSHSAGRYRRLAAALQLVDRQGPVSAADVQTFLVGMNQLAERFSADLRLPELDNLDARAVELDQFCAGVDVQIGINVVARNGGSITGTKLRGLAEANGFSLQSDGSFHFVDDEGRTLFSLTSQDGQAFTAESLRATTYSGVTLSLDVSRVAEGATAFIRMNVLAQQLGLAFNGAVVDDNRVPLDDRAVGNIRSKISELQSSMAKRGIEAGGPLALRLFS